MMRALENIISLLVFGTVICLFAPVYYTLKLIDWIKER